jgi:predicted ester cyclase
MSTEQNKAAKWRYIEAFNRRDLTAFPELLSAGYTLRATGFPEIHGPAELQRAVAVSFETLSDIRLTADDMVAEDDKVATRWTMRARHTGNFMGVAPTGKELAFSGTVIGRFVDGKVVEAWETVDMLGLMRQLGATAPFK